MIQEKESIDLFPWVLMILMSSVTFVGILSELMPSGMLPQIMSDFGVNEAQGRRLMSLRALASAIFGIPPISATMQYNRKKVLLWLLVGFALRNVLSGLIHNYYIVLMLHFLGGISAGVMWSMIVAFDMRLVHPSHQGRAMAVTMASNTLGISLGIPPMTSIGDKFGWRIEFIVLGLLVALVAVLSLFMLPFTPGEKLTKSTSPFAMLKNKPILLIIFLTLLGVCGHYGAYTCITRLVAEINVAEGIEVALMVLDIGSLISIIIVAKYIDLYLRELTIAMFAFLAIAMLLFYSFKGAMGISQFGFSLWGLPFGPSVTLFQAAVGNQVKSGKDVVMSAQSYMFNLFIVITTWIVGLLLISFGPTSLVWYAVLLAVPGMITSIFAKHALRRIGRRASSLKFVKKVVHRNVQLS